MTEILEKNNVVSSNFPLLYCSYLPVVFNHNSSSINSNQEYPKPPSNKFSDWCIFSFVLLVGLVQEHAKGYCKIINFDNLLTLVWVKIYLKYHLNYN